MSPYQHGEVFVTDDGAETDLDLGHYERFIDENLTFNSSVSAGKVYWNVLNRERAGDYLGGTVQIIPHITDEIKRHIYALEAPDVDAAIVEIGGTVGDIESQPFLEAIRQVAAERGRQNVMFIHVSLIVSIPGSGELKSKPTQHSAKELLGLGIQPDVIMCRSDSPIPQEILDKISLFCNIPADHAIPNLTAELLYEVPLMLEREGLADVVVRRLGLICHAPDLTEWTAMVHRAKRPEGSVTIALVGKYVGLHDAYLSVAEALTHGGIGNGVSVEIRWVNSEEVTAETADGLLAGVQGILVPGGFGSRGIDGKLEAIRYARENGVPFLGICLGMQLAVVEFARNVCGLTGAHSSELDPRTPYPVIDLMPDQVGVTAKGGTMRLGSYPGGADPGGAGPVRPVPGRAAGGGGGAAGAPLVRGVPVPPGAEVPAQPGAPAVPGVYPGRCGAVGHGPPAPLGGLGAERRRISPASRVWPGRRNAAPAGAAGRR